MANENQQEPYVSLLSAVLHAEAQFEQRITQGAIVSLRYTKDHLALLQTHPMSRERWSKPSEQVNVAVLVQIGFNRSNDNQD